MDLEKLAEKHAKQMWGDPTLERQRNYAEHSFKQGYEAHEQEVENLTIPVVSGYFECVVLYREQQGDKELRQSHHVGKTKDEAICDFFDKIGEKGINVLWLNNR